MCSLSFYLVVFAVWWAVTVAIYCCCCYFFSIPPYIEFHCCCCSCCYCFSCLLAWILLLFSCVVASYDFVDDGDDEVKKWICVCVCAWCVKKLRQRTNRHELHCILQQWWIKVTRIVKLFRFVWKRDGIMYYWRIIQLYSNLVETLGRLIVSGIIWHTYILCYHIMKPFYIF